MNIPDSERVIYKINPLIEVKCQINFPTILRISTQEPATFQEKIRPKYPLYELVKEPLVPDNFKDILNQVEFNNSIVFTPIYQFTSNDLAWRVSLSKNFISLATKQYKKYEEFKNNFQEILEIFDNCFHPSFYSSANLKYQDLIIRSELKLDNSEWTELINPDITSELYNEQLKESISKFIKIINFTVEGGEIVFKHGLVEVEDSDQKSTEEAYLLETDFFTQIDIQGGNNVWKYLDKYNRVAENLFRWSITERLHKAMDPETLKS